MKNPEMLEALSALAIEKGISEEIMLEAFGVTEERWRDATINGPPDFALSESPRYVGRAVAALAADAERGRWNQRSLTSGQLAQEYGFTDIDHSQPDIWRYLEDTDRGMAGNLGEYR